MNSLQDKVAVVTGASKGIGAAVARGMGAAGASVVVNYASSKADADEVVAAIQRSGGKAIAVQGDMSRPQAVRQLFAESGSTFGRVDVLVNNAGVYNFAPVGEVTEEVFHRDYDLNVLGPIIAMQEALKLFPAEGGSIINISSIVSANPLAGMLVYASSKAALDVVTKVSARELGSRNVRVNSILPGFTETPGNSVNGDLRATMLSQTPLGRLGRSEDIARVAVFLASPEAAWITGETIRVSGGLL